MRLRISGTRSTDRSIERSPKAAHTRAPGKSTPDAGKYASTLTPFTRLKLRLRLAEIGCRHRMRRAPTMQIVLSESRQDRVESGLLIGRTYARPEELDRVERISQQIELNEFSAENCGPNSVDLPT